MKSCDSFESQMLDHLYGLSSADESLALTEHLAGCQDCRSALARAGEQKSLLGAAAKAQFADVTFAAPAIAMVQTTAKPEKRSGAQWGRWAVAAGLLLAVAGVSIPMSRYWRQSDQVALTLEQSRQAGERMRQLQQERATKLAMAEKEVQSIRETIASLSVAQQKKLWELERDINNKQLHMSITGPETVEAGAPNQFSIATRTLDQRPAPAKISARILDETKKVVYEKQEVNSTGDLQITLPRDLPIKPKSRLTLEVRAQGKQGQEGQLSEKLQLVAPVYLTHLTTDKPMYQPGEVVRFRSLTLERFSLKPVQEELHLVYTLTRPTGAKEMVVAGLDRLRKEPAGSGGLILGPDKKPIQGIGAGEYRIDPNAPGGEYTLSVGEAYNRFLPQERKFIVNRYEKPRFNKELEFTRKSYGPGEEVVAACKIAWVETRKPFAGKPLTATAKVDGVTYGVDGRPGSGWPLTTDAQGAVNVKFKLPAQMGRGEASLALAIYDGSVETIVRSIPIVLKKLQVEFFPEGGDLVAGVPNRVYFQARTTLDRPAEVRGRIVDEGGKVAAHLETFNEPSQPGANQGMGRFSFTPAVGRTYELKIEAPEGIEGRYTLPVVKQDGVVLSIPTGVTREKEAIHTIVYSADVNRTLLLGAYCRGRLLAYQRVAVAKGQPTEVDLNPEGGAGGVYRVTAFEEQAKGADHVQLVPRAERLIYRVPTQKLNVKIQPNKKKYVPGDRVTLSYTATDEKDKATAAILMTSVVDKSVVKLADEKTFRSMPTHFLLTTEIRKPEDLEHADFLVGDHPKAGEALDLLLGTQGWRRFAEQDPGQFRQKHTQDADRLLVAIGQMSAANPAGKTTDFDSKALATALTESRQKMSAEQQELNNAEQKKTALANDAAFVAEMQRLQAESVSSQQQYRAAAAKFEEYQKIAGRLRTTLLPALAVILLAIGLGSLAVGALRKNKVSIGPYLALAGCSMALLVAVAYAGLFYQPAGGPSQYRQQIALADDMSQLDRFAVPAPAAGPQATGFAAPATGPAAPWRDLGAVKNEPVPQAAGPQMLGAIALPKAVNMNAAEGLKRNQGLNKGFALAPAKPERKMMEAERKEFFAPANKFDDRDQAKGEGRNRILGRAEKEVLAAKDGEFKKRNGGRGDEKAAVLDQLRAPALLQQEAKQQMGVMHDKVKDLKDLLPALPGGGPAGREAMGGIEQGGFGGGLAGEPQGFGRFAALDARGRFGYRGGELAKAVAEPPPPLVVREYSHQHRQSQGSLRTDFTETLYWNPVIVLADGKGEVSFDLCDSVTTFEVLAAAHTLDGRLGSVTAEFESRLPLNLEPKLPIEVTASDKIDVPLTISNSTDNARQVRVRLQTTGLSLLGGTSNVEVALKPEERVRRLFRLQPTMVEGESTIRFDGETSAFAADQVERSIKVVAEGFPVVASQSDVLEGQQATNRLILPESWLKGTLKYQVAVYPSTLADLQKGLEAMLREPCGCFEQTSTSNYPNLLILDYLKETDQAKPEIAKRAKDLLARGYQQLVSFECLNQGANKKEGYEWFGGTAPAHEALTAYGLLQFRDMARVYDVDPAMVERTKTYLMAHKDGKGGFTRNARSLDSFGRAPDNITNAYIVWALTESGKEDDVSRELDALYEQSKTSKDPYFLALVSTSLINRGRGNDALALLRKLAEGQQADGHLDAATTSITGSGGRDLQIETTALTLLAWLKANRQDQFNANIQLAAKWIGKQRGGYGGYGSTQSTIMSLKALIAFARANKHTPEEGDLVLLVNRKEIARQHFGAGVQEAVVLKLPEPEQQLKPGENRIDIKISGKNTFPYTATWSYQTLKPVSEANCPVGLSARLDRDTAQEGETVRMTVKVENQSGKGQGMTVAIIGLPAGLTLPEDMKQLKDLARLRNNGTEAGPISAWETRGRELILYWRDMAPAKQMEVNVDLICRVPGEYRGPASRAYLYYNADHKCWIEPLKMVIKAKAE